jgi:hypothetical protein
MRGTDQQQHELFSYGSLEERISAYRKSKRMEAKLVFAGHLLTENRNGLEVDVRLTQATDMETESDAAYGTEHNQPQKRHRRKDHLGMRAMR